MQDVAHINETTIPPTKISMKSIWQVLNWLGFKPFSQQAQINWQTMEIEGGNRPTTWNEFEVWCKNDVEPEITQNWDMMQWYHNAIQRENQSVQSFFAYIAALKQDLDNLPDEAFCVPFLWMKLWTNIQLELDKLQHQPATVSELREQAILIKSILGKRTKPTNPTNKRLDENKKHGISISQGWGASQQDNDGKPPSTKKHLTNPLPRMLKEEHKWQMDEGLCLRCGQPGHRAKSCTTNTNRFQKTDEKREASVKVRAAKPMQGPSQTLRWWGINPVEKASRCSMCVRGPGRTMQILL